MLMLASLVRTGLKCHNTFSSPELTNILARGRDPELSARALSQSVFARFGGKSVNRGLPVLYQARAQGSRSLSQAEGSWALNGHNNFCSTDRNQHCACLRSTSRKTQCLLEGLDGSPDPTGSESRRREKRKNSDNTASCHLVCDVLVP